MPSSGAPPREMSPCLRRSTRCLSCHSERSEAMGFGRAKSKNPYKHQNASEHFGYYRGPSTPHSPPVAGANAPLRMTPCRIESHAPYWFQPCRMMFTTTRMTAHSARHSGGNLHHPLPRRTVVAKSEQQRNTQRRQQNRGQYCDSGLKGDNLEAARIWSLRVRAPTSERDLCD